MGEDNDLYRELYALIRVYQAQEGQWCESCGKTYEGSVNKHVAWHIYMALLEERNKKRGDDDAPV